MQMIAHTPSTMRPLPRRNQSGKQSSQTAAGRMRSDATHKHTHIYTHSLSYIILAAAAAAATFEFYPIGQNI